MTNEARVVRDRLIVWIHLLAGQSDDHGDPRRAVLDELTTAARHRGLRLRTPAGLDGSFSGIFERGLFDEHSEGLLLRTADGGQPKGGDGRCWTGAAYRHHDALILQLAVGVAPPDAASGADRFCGLREAFARGFDGGVLERAAEYTFGVTLLYWLEAGGLGEEARLLDEVGRVFEERDVEQTATDLGPLWRVESPMFTDAPSVSQDLWLLVTSREVNGQAAVRYWELRPELPAFLIASLARHKFEFEWRDYLADKPRVAALKEDLNGKTDSILSNQSRVAERLENRMQDLRTFQESLSDAAWPIAELQQKLSRIRELRRTLEINRGNFLIHGAAVMSGEGRLRVRSSQRQQETASQFLAARDDDAVFGRGAGWMGGLIEQVDADLDYSGQALHRYEIVLESGLAQLQVASQHELVDMSRTHGIEAAAVIASLAGFVAVELLKLGAKSIVATNPRLAFNLVLFAVAGSFALARMLFTSGRPKSWVDRGSFAVAVGFLAGTLTAWRWSLSALFVAGFVVAGTVGGGLVYALAESLLSGRKQAPKKREPGRLDPL